MKKMPILKGAYTWAASAMPWEKWKSGALRSLGFPPTRQWMGKNSMELAFWCIVVMSIAASGSWSSAAEEPLSKGKDEIIGFLVVAPSVIRVDEPFAIGIKALVRPYVVGEGHPEGSPANQSSRGAVYMDNVPVSWPGSVAIACEGDGWKGPTTFAFPGGRPIARIEGFRFDAPGIKFVWIGKTKADPGLEKAVGKYIMGRHGGCQGERDLF
jgi:hypothetical protein